MNALSSFTSRAVKLDIVLVVVQQLNDINLPATAYSVARALDCSHPTARKYLRELETVGGVESVEVYEPHRTKVLYTAVSPTNNTQRINVSQYLNEYHIARLK